MTADSIQRKMYQRRDIMEKICELAEADRPEDDRAMTPADEHRIHEIYSMLSRAMDLPRMASWLDY